MKTESIRSAKQMGITVPASSVQFPKERCAVSLVDNRQSNVVQQKKINDHHVVAGEVVQLVAYKNMWGEEEGKYQAKKVGHERIDGDAEWLAIVRFCRGLVKAPGETVQNVLDKAEKNKGVSFQKWKGSQKTNDGQEAQHLVSASYASGTLKWPYSFINSEHNGKMLLAGRGGTQLNPSQEYINAKQQKGKLPNRGILHIINGVAHNAYDKSLKQYVEDYYKKHGFTIGTSIPDANMKEITDYLREKHKEHDGKKTLLGVDNLDLSAPLVSTHASSSSSGTIPVKKTTNKTNPELVRGSLMGAGGLVGLGLAKAATYLGFTMIGGGALATGGALLGGMAGLYAAHQMLSRS